jgi:hypothetical protein
MQFGPQRHHFTNLRDCYHSDTELGTRIDKPRPPLGYSSAEPGHAKLDDRTGPNFQVFKQRLSPCTARRYVWHGRVEGYKVSEYSLQHYSQHYSL